MEWLLSSGSCPCSQRAPAGSISCVTLLKDPSLGRSEHLAWLCPGEQNILTDDPSRSKWMRDGSLGHKEGAESEVGVVGTWWATPCLTFHVALVGCHCLGRS